MAKGGDVPAAGGLCGARCSARYVLAVFGSIGMGIIYGLKVNLHVAIVSMVNHTVISAEVAESSHKVVSSAADQCRDGQSSNDTISRAEDGPFIWNHNVQGLLLSAYFWGYIVAQLPGGRIAELFSAKWVMFFAVSINIICTLLTPAFSTLGYGYLLALRVGEGIGGGVTFPSMHVMLAKWAPPAERSVMSSIVYAGTALGSVIFMLLSGVIAAGVGWEAVFYIEGGFSAIWLVLWFWLIADSPQKQRYIADDERQYIMAALESESGDRKKPEKLKMPWKAVLTSPAFLAILVAHTCSNWGWYMVLIELPQYMKHVLNFKISENAVLSSMPFFIMWLFSIVLSKVLDTLRGKNVISTTTARKVATLCASVVPLVCFLALSYIGCQRVLAVVLMTIAVTAIGGMFCGFLSNHIDIAPNFAGTLVAITNTVATIPGIVVPIFVGALTENDPSIASWRIIFWVTIALYVVEILIYVLFASGEVQKWNQIEEPSIEEQPLKSQQSPTSKPASYEATSEK